MCSNSFLGKKKAVKRSLLKSYKLCVSPCQFYTLLVRSTYNKIDFENGTTFQILKKILNKYANVDSFKPKIGAFCRPYLSKFEYVFSR